MESSESVAQVIIALTELGISINDSRFVKNDITLKDRLLEFRTEDGGFRTYPGFSGAFQKEFHMSPTVYGQGVFEAIHLTQYDNEYKDSLRLTIVNLKPIRMANYGVISSKETGIDILAQVNYWMEKIF